MGSATDEFNKLQRVWKHSGINVARKLQIYQACILSKLLYNLHSLVLNTAEKRRVDAFHVRSLRRILKIAPSYYSRISNKSVLAQAGAKEASSMLLERQLIWMGNLARQSDTHVLRQTVLQSGPNRFRPKIPDGRRKRGRPKTCWATQVHQQAVNAAKGLDKLHDLWMNSKVARQRWARCVEAYCHK